MKNYTQFILESFNIDSKTLVDILKSLQTGKDQQIVIDKLTKNIDSSKRNILMNIVQSNNEELLDYVLQFDLNLNHLDKKGQNVLFYVKSIKIFKKLYQLGADVTVISNEGVTTLLNLSCKKLFNVELYQQIIDEGVDINKLYPNNQSILSNATENKSIVELLIKNKVNLNGDDKEFVLESLSYTFEYYEKKRKKSISVVKLLLDNGMKIDNIFFKHLLKRLNRNDRYIYIDNIKKHFNDDSIIGLYNYFSNEYTFDMVNVSKTLMNIFKSPALYQRIKKYYKSSTFKEVFADMIAEYPWYEEAEKYNL
jgi:hypothetical protein